MANDPHRDLLPVRDCSRNGKGFSDKFDYQILGKLSRCELEDRFLRLLDEQTHIKKLANSQEEKIKRLGTKLLRLINEKKSGKKFSEHNKETEDLHLRIIELEHENYTLKDKNTVLKQQLSSHTRHLITHRSPLRSTHTSPIMTTRQSGQTQNDCCCEPGSKNSATDMQLQEAESHIKELNKEIKCLHNKIHFLEQSLEKNNFDNRKGKVTENIELIRLQRSLKQQAIQIASLQEQVNNSEKTQTKLKEELMKAHSENEEALQLISVKQGEILALCSKLEEKNLNKLEEDELNERIRDLMLERDCLRERSDFLMKTIIAKAEECGKVKELQKLLDEEKCKKEKLEETLENLKCNEKSSSSEVFETVNYEKPDAIVQTSPFSLIGQNSSNKKELPSCACKAEDSESSRSPGSYIMCQSETSDTEPSSNNGGKVKTKKKHVSNGKCEVEKMKLELELQYLREMLRSQTLRCESQQAEISRLMYELKLNESKCSETLQRLDWHLRIFEGLEMRTLQNELIAGKDHEAFVEKPEAKEEETKLPKIFSMKDEKPETTFIIPKEEMRIPKEEMRIPKEEMRISKEEKLEKPIITPRVLNPPTQENWKKTSNLDNINYNKDSLEDVPSKLVSKEPTMSRDLILKESLGDESKKRFIDQSFLESSEDEFDAPLSLENQNFRSTFDKAGNFKSDESDIKEKYNLPEKRHTVETSAGSFPTKPYESKIKKSAQPPDDKKNVKISILWFKIKAGSSLWKNQGVEMLFIDFSFLDINGEETETPESVRKPKSPEEKCEFNFVQSIPLSESNVKRLKKLAETPEGVVIVLKVVSDSEKYDETNEECEDVGGAVITTKQFFENCNKGPFHVPVKSNEDPSEVIGFLSLSIEVPSKLLKTLKPDRII